MKEDNCNNSDMQRLLQAAEFLSVSDHIYLAPTLLGCERQPLEGALLKQSHSTLSWPMKWERLRDHSCFWITEKRWNCMHSSYAEAVWVKASIKWFMLRLSGGAHLVHLREKNSKMWLLIFPIHQGYVYESGRHCSLCIFYMAFSTDEANLCRFPFTGGNIQGLKDMRGSASLSVLWNKCAVQSYMIRYYAELFWFKLKLWIDAKVNAKFQKFKSVWPDDVFLSDLLRQGNTRCEDSVKFQGFKDLC